jgi:hypothetical protein
MAISTINQNGLNVPLTLTSPVLTTPNLGTPSALVLTNATALPAAALPAGCILQVQSYDFTGGVTSTSSNYTLLTASFTPKFATSKVLAMMTTVVEKGASGSGNYIYISLYRNGSNINSQWANALGYQYSTNARCVGALNYLDSPATTSAISYTYSGDFAVSGGVSWQFYRLNLTLMEVAA